MLQLLYFKILGSPNIFNGTKSISIIKKNIIQTQLLQHFPVFQPTLITSVSFFLKKIVGAKLTPANPYITIHVSVS